MKNAHIFIALGLACLLLAPASAQTSQGAFVFGSRDLTVPNPNGPGDYTMIHHAENSQAAHDALAYDPALGYGFVVINPGATGRNGGEQFGPFDDSPNNRNRFDDAIPEQLYDSFIGFKNHPETCDAALIGDGDTPCSPTIPPSGGIFRVDVPNGLYRFVGVFGDADNRHAHCVIAEDGGSGGPSDIGPNHVVLVSNHDQAQWDIGQTSSDPGDGVFARVGFDSFLPPPGDGVAPDPVFVDMDANGFPTVTGPDSPTLDVTQGYIQLHLLQGNSNDGVGGARDPNGTDIVLFEAHLIPEPSSALLALFGLLGFVASRRRKR